MNLSLNRLTIGHKEDLVRLLKHSTGRDIQDSNLIEIGQAAFSANWRDSNEVLLVRTPKERKSVILYESSVFLDGRLNYLKTVDDYLRRRDWALADALYVPPRFGGLRPRHLDGVLYQLSE